MIKTATFFIFIFFSFLSFAQQNSRAKLDSLYNSFLTLKNVQQKGDVVLKTSEEPPVKCAFTLISQVKHNVEFFTPQQQIEVNKLLERPSTGESIISPSGFFRIHYNRTGTDVPNYDPELSIDENVLQAALAADSAYNYEVNFLGYPPPPSDNSNGGDNLYDIYISSAAGMSYGYTQPEEAIGDQKFNSFIVIHYSFNNFFTKGFDAMKVTIAHELHHAIQLGNYSGDADKIKEDTFFYELTSTSMEEFVFDDVNDYYAYIPNYFNNTSRSFTRFESNNYYGYDLVIWNLFLDKKFGHNIIKSQWELFPQMRAVAAMNNTFSDYGTGFNEVLSEFGIWVFFTDYRAKENQYFDEAENYPVAKPLVQIDFDDTEENIKSISYPVANNYISLINTTKIPADTLTVLVTNSDYFNSSANPNQTFSYDYNLFNFAASGSRRLNEELEYYALFNTDNPNFWSTTEFLDTVLISNYKSVLLTDFPYPSPFRYGKNDFIFIPVNSAQSVTVDLNVYTSSMDLVYSGNKRLESVAPGVRWNVLDNKRQKLASGVYIYVVKSGNETTVGKLVIFNE